MRKMLLVMCGANRGGNTDRFCDMFYDGAKAAGHEVHKVFLGDNIHGCRGCGACQVSGKGCVIHDIMDEIYPLVDECDTIVMASPLFFWSVSSQMKAFVDRLYAIGKNDLYPKKAMGLLMTAGDDRPETFERAIQYFEGLAQIYGGDNLGVCCAGGCDGTPGHHQISEDNLRKGYEFGFKM